MKRQFLILITILFCVSVQAQTYEHTNIDTLVSIFKLQGNTVESAMAVNLDASGNLSIMDIGASDDQLTLTLNGTQLRITNPNKSFRISGQGVALLNPHTVEVALSSFTGDLIIDTKSGNDVLNLTADLALTDSHKIKVRGETTINQEARILFKKALLTTR